MQDFLSKFDSIQVNNNSRIAPEDQTFCEEQQSNYNEFIQFSDNYIRDLKNNSIYNVLYNSGHLIDSMEKTRDNIKDTFISKVVSFFRDKYKVTLKSDSIQKKYGLDIEYSTIVSEVIEQLSGYNFTDKAEKEIKDAFKETLRYDKIKIKNKKISIDSFFYIDSFDLKYKQYSVSYGSDEKFHKLFKAISHFLYGSSESKFDGLYRIITSERDDNVFTTHEIADDILKTLKVYKNGKIDLEFSNPDQMRKFAREYCGYIGELQTA